MSAPVSPISEAWPVWTDLSDNWRAIDAHWLRDRVVNVFDSTAARQTALTGQTLVTGGLSFLQDVFSLEFYKSGDPGLAASWESVRYPNLAVTSDATTVQLRRTGAGSGLILDSSGVANIEKLNAGLGALVVGVAGATLKVGTKSVLLATDAAALTIDSPVKITGALNVTGAVTATGALSGTTLALTGAVTGPTTITASSTIQGAAVTATGAVTGATVLAAGIALLTNNGTAASFVHNSQTASGFRANSDGTTTIAGSTNTISGTTNMATVNTSGTVTLNGATNTLAAGSASPVPVAGLTVVNRAPTGSDVQPNGTIWIQV